MRCLKRSATAIRNGMKAACARMFSLPNQSRTRASFRVQNLPQRRGVLPSFQGRFVKNDNVLLNDTLSDPLCGGS